MFLLILSLSIVISLSIILTKSNSKSLAFFCFSSLSHSACMITFNSEGVDTIFEIKKKLHTDHYYMFIYFHFFLLYVQVTNQYRSERNHYKMFAHFCIVKIIRKHM
jgi:hypothetical protein